MLVEPELTVIEMLLEVVQFDGEVAVSTYTVLAEGETTREE